MTTREQLIGLDARERLLSAVWWMLAGFLIGTGGLFLTLCFIL